VAATFAEFDAVPAHMGDVAGAYASDERRREYRDHRLEWMAKSGGIDVVLAGLRDNTIRFPWPDPA
jgi:RNA polymerase-associated protein